MNDYLRKSSTLWRWLGCAAGMLVVVNVPAKADATSDTAGIASDSGPIDLKLGPFDFQPRASTEVRYDDNILFSQNPESDLIWDLKPGIQAVVGDKLSLLAIKDWGGNPFTENPDGIVTRPPENWPGMFLIIDESPFFEWFTQHQKNNFIGNVGGFNLILPENKFIFGATLNYDNEPITVVQAGQYSAKESIDSTISGAYFIGGNISVDNALSYHRESYQEPILVGYTGYSDVTWLNYQWSELLNISTGVTGGLDYVPGNQNQRYLQLLARARYQFAQKLAFNVSAGGEYRHYESGIPDSLTPVFDVGASYQVGERTSLTLTGRRDTYAALIGGYIYTVTGVTAAVNQGIGDRFSTTLSGTFGYYEPTAATVASSSPATPLYTSDFFSIQLQAEYKITPQLVGQVFYNYRTDSNQAYAISDDVVGLQLTWKY